MADHFISLTCANCGGKLDVYDDMERFACGYCGSAMIVQRRGATVALRAVTEAIKGVQIGTDKTAAELALVRYEKELQELKAKKEPFRKEESQRFAGLGCGGLMIIVAIFTLLTEANGGDYTFGAVILIIGILAAYWGYQRGDKGKKLAKLDSEIAQLKERIAEKRQLADN